MQPNTPSTCFSARRLNASTFLIVEDDKWGEYPLIYAKVYDGVVVLVDTGCGGAARDEGVEVKRLREFLETVPVQDVDGDADGGEEGDGERSNARPINEVGKRGYVVLCTHCHYDHIGAVEQFPDAAIWASAFDESFITDPKAFPTHSLCRFVGMKTPRYEVARWAEHGARVTYSPTSTTNDAVDLGLVIYHTPGHTPDSLSIFDEQERVLLVGDTAYEWAPILFPIESSIYIYKRSLEFLLALVHRLNCPASSSPPTSSSPLRLASGHITSDVDAEDFLQEVYSFLCEVQTGTLEPRFYRRFRGEEEVLYERGDGRVSFAGPRRKFEGWIGKGGTRLRGGCCVVL
ncbi:beta-lactamase-like protein [Phaeosphaeria sp. MPI-PUGE-AT-0046c]|nr:beta-lactamase-like protein [Phaeosphaeria sp. MPI-PUGE-AT-0046c]